MPHIDNPAPAERMAVLETRLLPGSESTIDCALDLGSSLGTLDAYLAGVRWVERGWSALGATVGLRMGSPVETR